MTIWTTWTEMNGSWFELGTFRGRNAERKARELAAACIFATRVQRGVEWR